MPEQPPNRAPAPPHRQYKHIRSSLRNLPQRLPWHSIPTRLRSAPELRRLISLSRIKWLTWFACGLTCVGILQHSHAQELTPRRWNHIPVETNIVGLGYVYTEADIFLNPTLRLENVDLRLHSAALHYIHSFEVLHKSARIELNQAYVNAHWDGLVEGIPDTLHREGLSDTRIRLAVNLIGAPPLKGQDYRDYRRQVAENETIVGAGLQLQLPTGQYENDTLLNIGTNRFTIRPQLGIIQKLGNWSLEASTAAWLYTDNKRFRQGSTLSNAPYYTVQGHLLYKIHPRLWSSLSLGYGTGMESKVDGISQNDRKQRITWGATVGYALRKDLALKLAYFGYDARSNTGSNAENLALITTYLW